MAKIPILTSTNVKELSRVNLVLWVNSLNLLDQPIENIKQLDDAIFFVRLLDFLFPGKFKDLNSYRLVVICQILPNWIILIFLGSVNTKMLKTQCSYTHQKIENFQVLTRGLKKLNMTKNLDYSNIVNNQNFRDL